MEKFLARPIPNQASSQLREYLQDQISRMQILLNGAALRDENETISGEWTFSGSLTVVDATGTDTGMFWHDGTDFRADFVNTRAWVMTGLERIDLEGNETALRIDPEGNGNIIARRIGTPANTSLDFDVNNGNSEFEAQYRFGRVTNTLKHRLLFLRGNGGAQTAAELEYDNVTFRAAFRLGPNGSIFIEAANSAAPDVASYGQIWVRSSDMALMYTDDQGNDHQIAFA